MMMTRRTKRKIPIEKRETKQQRSLTCTRRRKTVFSKAAKLCLHSGADIAAFVTSPAESNDVVYSFSGYSPASAIADCYLSGKPLPTIKNPKPMLGFFWENPNLHRSCEDVSDFNIMEDRLERMEENVTASLEKEENPNTCSGSSSQLDQNPNFSFGSSSQIASFDQTTSYSSLNQVVSSQVPTFDQNPNFSFVSSFGQNSSYSSLDQIDSSQIATFDSSFFEENQGGSSNSSDQSCFFENNTMTLTQETTQTEPMMANVGDCDREQSFWDTLYNDDVFGFNNGFPLGHNNAQAYITSEEDDCMIEIRKFLNEEEIGF